MSEPAEKTALLGVVALFTHVAAEVSFRLPVRPVLVVQLVVTVSHVPVAVGKVLPLPVALSRSQ